MLVKFCTSSSIICLTLISTALASHAQATDLVAEDSASIGNNFTREAEVLGPFAPATLPTNPPEVESDPTQTALTTSPAVEPAEILSQYGLVRSLKGDQLSVRLIDGTARTYKVAANSATQTFRRGSLVGFDVNGNDQIVRLAPPRVRRVFEGTVIVVEENKLGLVSPTGEQLVTSLSKDKINRMKIEPGRTLRVTQYEGTWATKVCLPAEGDDVAALSQTLPETTSAEPVGGADFSDP
ncbi:hypothetical protein [Acaryochloris sp. IP29b_bin.137]|uniref:hypothetical protein n=1 Tax=Acaryochloris sp. IP29b_bin.137 TaxID=2969217 RepID=UPI0026365AF7|nr:hypothetical protein [Acaryochloris sp. IP29b_bin.137]